VQIAKATAKILQYADKPETQNRTLHVQSFCKTQKQVKEALERVTGEEWKVKNFDSEQYLKEQRVLMAEGNKEATAAGCVDSWGT
jgi:hypothetical protein